MKQERLSPGPELDALVAERVIGLEHRDWAPYCTAEGWHVIDSPACFEENPDGTLIDPDEFPSCLPCYSTNIAHAWEVVAAIAERLGLIGHNGFTLVFSEDCGKNRTWYCEFPEPWVSAEATTAPHAICLAALKAVGK